MKKLEILIKLGVIATFIYELLFLFKNGTAGNVDHIVVVMIIAVIGIVSFFIKSIFKITKWLFLITVIYTVGSHIVPLLNN